MLGSILRGNVLEVVRLVVVAFGLVRPVGLGVELVVLVFACTSEGYLRVKEVALRAVVLVGEPVVLKGFRKISLMLFCAVFFGELLPDGDVFEYGALACEEAERGVTGGDSVVLGEVLVC